jgi:CheY-like chemotaxis protein
MTSQSTESSDIRPVDVLLVEDNPADVELTQRILQDSDYPLNIAVAEDGEVAMNVLRKVGVHSNSPRPDLILLDLNMPRKTGYEVLAEMNDDEDLSRIPVLILTSTQAERDRLQFENVGPSRYCTKPLPVGRFNTIMSQLRSDEYVSWTSLGNLDDTERESRILSKYTELAEASEAQREDRVLPLVRAEFDLFDEKLRAITVSKLRVWLQMDASAAKSIAGAYSAAMQQMPADAAMRRATQAARLRNEFSEEEQGKLLALSPDLFGRVAPPPPTRPAPQSAAQQTSNRRWWWPFGR